MNKLKRWYACVLYIELRCDHFFNKKARKNIMAILTSMAVGLGSKIADETIGQIGANKRLKKNVEAQKDLTKFNQEQQFDLWNKTNYEAQVEHIKKAGLSPALMYGGSGAGGATTGSGGGSVTAGNAQSGGMDLMTASQIKVAEAQAQNLEADAKLKEVQANKTAGVDTQNTIADTAIKQAETEIKNVAARVANDTEKQQVDQITYAANEQIEKAREQFNKAQVAEETQRDAINKIKKEAIGVGIENILKEAQVGKTRTETNAIINDVKQKWEQVKQGWKNLDINEKQNKINEFKTTIEAQYPNLWNVAGRAIDDMITEIVTIGGTQGERHKTKTIK